MKILWLVNMALPEINILQNESPNNFGGWITSIATSVSESRETELCVAFPQKGLKDVRQIKGESIIYYTFPPIGEKEAKSAKENIFLKNIVDRVKPDIVHIFGTESAHAPAMVNTCKNEKVVISIHGLLSIIQSHYMSGLPENIQKRFTLRNILLQDNIRQRQRVMKKQGMLEIEALRKVKHIIGRTEWDKACSTQINPNAKYYSCNETLRDEYYKHTWNIDKCEKYSIFVSQATDPFKGLHFMIEAMASIVKKYPEAVLYVGGVSPVKSNAFFDKIKTSSYGKYLKYLIKKNNLEKKIVFTGILNEKQMCERYLSSNVYVSCSTIENESNSVGEAKILGVPVVASYVGGVTSRLEHGIDGFFYRYDEPEMLAYYISKIFEDKNLSLNLSKNAKENAKAIYDKDKNVETLLKIYKTITET